jgi:hypothetical protein
LTLTEEGLSRKDFHGLESGRAFKMFIRVLAYVAAVIQLFIATYQLFK